MPASIQTFADEPGAGGWSVLDRKACHRILSVIGGMALMRTAPVVLGGALRPDLLRWEHVPAAFVVTRASKPELEPCLVKFGAVQRLW
jgi:hypothetical protein